MMAQDIEDTERAIAPMSAGRAFAKQLLARTAFWIALIDIGLIIMFGLLSRNNVFFSLANFQNLALDGAQIVLLSIGAAILLSAGEFDISIGSNVVLSSVVSGLVVASIPDWSGVSLVFVGGLTGVLVGAAVGLMNGLIVTRLKINSLIGTLGTLGIVTGIANILTGGADVPGIPATLQMEFGTKYLWGLVPIPALVTLAVAAVAWVVMSKTRFGIHTLATGSSRIAADRAGINTATHLTILYALVGSLSGLAALIDISRFSTTNLAGHQIDSLSAIVGAVIGGTSLFGGRISIWGAPIGAMLAVILQAGLVVLGFPPFYQLIAIGVVLLIAVYTDEARAGRSGGLSKK